jgi:glycosyltransferase involved in cell wall biosynthesis
MRVMLLAESMIDYAYAFACAVAGHCDTRLVTPERLLEPYRPQLPPNLEAPPVHWPRPRSPRNLPFTAALPGLIRKWRPDLVHVLSQSVTWPALALPLRGRIPLMQTVHDVQPHPGDDESARTPEVFNRLLRAQADALVVHGQALRPSAAARFAKPESQVHVIPHLALTRYVDLAAAQPPLPKDDRFDVLFFGRVYRYKGLDHLITAAESLGGRIPTLRVTVAGYGSDWERCRRLILNPWYFDLHDGFVPDEEAAALFARADLVVLPYVEASQSGVIALALAMGKPMVVTDVGDFAEATGGPAPCALLVPPADPAALAEAMLRLYADPALRVRLGLGARTRARGPLSPERIGARAAEVYRAVLAQGRRGARGV